MNYSVFCSTFLSTLTKQLEPDMSLKRQRIQKNNGVILDAVILFRGQETTSPVVYLEPLYESFQKGCPMETLCRAALACLEHELPFDPGILSKIHDPESVKKRIAFRLVSQKDNKELLEDVPWFPFLDLAVVFFIRLSSSDKGQVTALIRNSLLKLWDMPKIWLLSRARINMPVLFPSTLTPMGDLLSAPPFSLPKPDPDIFRLHVLTNESGLYGASCILYDHAVKDFADQMGTDVIILPSSVHEVLLLPDLHMLDYDFLCSMVQDINRTEVSKEETLSDHIYLYTRCDGAIKSWPQS